MEQADLIIHGARALTMDPARLRAEAVAVAGGRIVAVGRDAEVLAFAGPGTRIIDAAGRTLLPGFVESHLHLVLGAAELPNLRLGGVMGAGALKAAFQAYASANPDLPLLMAQAADYGVIGHPVTRHDLDAVIADRPIAMMASDLHTVWANTAALRAAGILHGAQLSAGHEVVLAADGTATGELREFEAFGPVLALGGAGHLQLGIATGEEPDPWPGAERQALDRAIVRAGLAHCARQGITSMVNMDGNRYTCVLLRDVMAEGGLTARIKVPFHFKPHMALDALSRASALAGEFRGDWLRAGFVKMFMDGVVDSRTAFMLNDYPGMPGHRGAPLFEASRFNDICAEADRRGLQIAVHAVGDGAVRAVIDGYQAAQRRNGPRDARHRIEHIELIDPADRPRLGALGITASVQPVHAPGAMDFPASAMEAVIPRSRWPDAYQWQGLAEHGAPLAFASDWPVADVSVLRGIQATLCKGPYDGAADQRPDLLAVLHAYTAGGARAAHLDDITGTLRVGMMGDLVLLGGDIESISVQGIAAMGVALTVAGGRITHQAAEIA